MATAQHLSTAAQTSELECVCQEYLGLIEEVVAEVSTAVDEQRVEQNSAIEKLEHLLAQKTLRRSDFADMTQRLLQIQRQREEDAKRMLLEFLEGTESLVSTLHELIERPDVKKMKQLVRDVEWRKEEKNRREGRRVEELLENLSSSIERGMEQFRSERIAINNEWLQSQKKSGQLYCYGRHLVSFVEPIRKLRSFALRSIQWVAGMRRGC